jgi:hypothetical protein
VAHFEVVHAPPILAIQDGYIVVAATVLYREKQNGNVYIHVATWHEGYGQHRQRLSPADYASWRSTFTLPDHEA